MSSEKISLLSQVVTAVAALSGVAIGSIFSYWIARQQIRATVISANRQQWINTLRDCIADFQTKAKIANVESRLASNDITSIAADVKSHDEALKTMRFQLNKIALLINPNEKDHAELHSMMKDLWDLCINGDPSDQVSQERLQDSITSTSQRILKREWERVKHGK
jgi:hypothetical protein